ncbi:protein of unknown function [Magnetospirillum sp. XM-1]|nr:protein of unknown function [Magnetospirillum sp. XM-1]
MLSDIGQEHARLYEMIGSLSAVIAASPNERVINDGISIISERLKLHFDIEERALEFLDAELNVLMHSDHQLILSKIETARACVSGDRQKLIAALDEVKSSLKKHDRELDWPIFHYVNNNECSDCRHEDRN